MEAVIIGLVLAAIAGFVYLQVKRSNARSDEGGMGARPEPREDTDFK